MITLNYHHRGKAPEHLRIIRQVLSRTVCMPLSQSHDLYDLSPCQLLPSGRDRIQKVPAGLDISTSSLDFWSSPEDPAMFSLGNMAGAIQSTRIFVSAKVVAITRVRWINRANGLILYTVPFQVVSLKVRPHQPWMSRMRIGRY